MPKIAIGDKVNLGKRKGIIRYIGPITVKGGIWYGIECTGNWKGDCDGKFYGKRYFQTKAKKAQFVSQRYFRSVRKAQKVKKSESKHNKSQSGDECKYERDQKVSRSNENPINGDSNMNEIPPKPHSCEPESSPKNFMDKTVAACTSAVNCVRDYMYNDNATDDDMEDVCQHSKKTVTKKNAQTHSHSHTHQHRNFNNHNSNSNTDYMMNENCGVFNGVNVAHNNANTNTNNNNNNRQFSTHVFKHAQVRVRSQKTITTDTQLLLDTFADCALMLDKFVDVLAKRKTGNATKKRLLCINSVAVTNMNIFSALCADELENNNKRGVDLVSHKLKEYVQKLDETDRQLLDPFINYAVCAVQGLECPLLEGIRPSLKMWENGAQSFMAGMLAADHVVSERVQSCNEQTHELRSQFEQEWQSKNQKGATFNKGRVASAKQMSQQMFKYNDDASDLDLGYGYSDADPNHNPPLAAQLDMMGSYPN